MKKALCFDDVLLVPKFSEIRSRSDANTSTSFLGLDLKIPVISSNMDTITEVDMSLAMAESGGIGCLHRFTSVANNCYMYEQSVNKISQTESRNFPMVSIGIGESELNRAVQLARSGANIFIIDVAHGAALHVVEMYDRLREVLGVNAKIIVGNFATADSILEFNKRSTMLIKPDAYKVGVGGGSVCITRVVTGCGVPTLTSVIDCSRLGFPIIADGGIRNSGDLVKVLAAGATVVMIGGLLAGTTETPGEVVHTDNGNMKRYRGSASKESYEVQGKSSVHRTPEGEATYVNLNGSVNDVLTTLKAGLVSGMSYLNANNLEDLKSVEMIEITSSSLKENSAHRKN